MLGELQPWLSGGRLDRLRRDIDEVFERFFGEVGYRSPKELNCDVARGRVLYKGRQLDDAL
jgi:hypothetical protein